MLIGLSIIWGSSFLLIKKALIAFTPIQVGSLRVIIAGSVLFVIGFKHLTNFNKKNILPLIGVGLVGSGIPAILFAIAQTKVASSASGALNSLTPLFTFLIGSLLFKTPIKTNKVLGVLVGLFGAILLFYQNNAFELGNVNFYLLLIVLATICYATSINLVKNFLQEVPSTTITLCSFLFVFPIFIPLLFSTNIIAVFQNPSSQLYLSLAAISFLAIVGTAIANVIFFKLTQQSSALFAASVTYLIPFVATFLGYADGEYIGIYHFLGLVLVIYGVYLISKSQNQLQ